MSSAAEQCYDPPVLLSALIAPGSVEAELGKVQANLFSAHGFASAQALPPLVPIAFLDAARVGRAFLREMDGAIPRSWRVRLAAAAWVGGHLFAHVESGGAWAALRAFALSRCGSEAEAPFPAAEGFYLGCSEAPVDLRAGITPLLPLLSFSSGTVALVRICTGSEGPGWWRELHWEIAEERPLRGRKRQ